MPTIISSSFLFSFFFQAEDGIRDRNVTGVQTCALPILNLFLGDFGGVFAPRSAEDPAEIAKEEIQQALFSQEEVHDIPLDLQTQYFKKDQEAARLAVLAHLDVKGVRFRKAEGRNNNQLTIAMGVFDENGQFVTGMQKIIDMKLLDTTYARLMRSGLTAKSSFDVKPGTYLVRLVVRDAEGAQMAARNGAVVIPF